MKKLVLLVVLVALGAGAWWYVGRERERAAPVWRTAPLRRGAVVEAVSTTGTLQAVTTVQVGTQVSGVLEEILVDFNSRVRKGQVIARLDTDALEARLAQDEAALAAAEASVERARVALEEARSREQRTRRLFEQRLAKEEDVEAATFAVRAAEATLRAEQTRVTQAQGAVRMARTNLDYATITSPIDGVVLTRDVDVGQTVAASLQAPTLFTIAEDLRQMRVEVAVDEADIGRIQSGQRVSFTVDAYPERTFEGRVEQRRLGPTVTNNVVTYQVIVATDNPDEALLPGMTANVSIEVARADDTWFVPAAALRFRPPTAEGEGEAGPPPGTRRGPPPGGQGDQAGQGGPRGQAGPGATRGGARGGRTQQVWVLGRRDGVDAPRPVPVRVGPTDGSVVAIEPVEEGSLKEGDAILVGLDDGSGGRSGPVNPMSLLRGRR